MLKATVTPSGPMESPGGVAQAARPGPGGQVLVEETSDAIVLRTVAQSVARARSMSDRLVAGRAGASALIAKLPAEPGR